MLIGIISDTHDNLPLIDKAVKKLDEMKVERILHAGDVVSPFAAKKLAAAKAPVIAVFGNNDGEREGLSKVLDIAPGPRRVEIAGKVIVMAHALPQIKDEHRKGAHVLIHGHTHNLSIDKGPPLSVNPGECSGWLTGRPTIAVLDTETMEAKFINL
jgi:putative phosphoesterase